MHSDNIRKHIHTYACARVSVSVCARAYVHACMNSCMCDCELVCLSGVRIYVAGLIINLVDFIAKIWTNALYTALTKTTNYAVCRVFVLSSNTSEQHSNAAALSLHYLFLSLTLACAQKRFLHPSSAFSNYAHGFVIELYDEFVKFPTIFYHTVIHSGK